MAWAPAVSAPSDANMAVGQNPSYNYIFQTVNSRYAIYTKSGALVVGPNSLSSLWAPLGNSNGCATNNGGDVVAQYDKLADRWIITQLGGTSRTFFRVHRDISDAPIRREFITCTRSPTEQR